MLVRCSYIFPYPILNTFSLGARLKLGVLLPFERSNANTL